MFCKFCGAKIADNATFCSACGKAQNTAATQQTTQVPPVPPQQTYQPTMQIPPIPPQQPYQQPAYPQYAQQPRSSGAGKAIVIALIAIAVIGGIMAGVMFSMKSKQEHERQLSAAQQELDELQKAAEEAQQAAADAQAEAEAAQAQQAEAEQAAANAQAEADAAKIQAEAIIAAINAAKNGQTVTYSGYIFPSDRTYITEADMRYWDQTTALLARNEIFARHGYVFQTDYIQNYFSAQSWYYPNPQYKGTGLSKVEQANVDTILAYEKKKGWQ